MVSTDITAFVCSHCGQRYEVSGYCPNDGQALAMTDDPLMGTDVGRYRLARLLGEGGMGRVYLAVQPAIGSRVAVKVLADQCARNPELLERFFAEARAVNLVSHEGIVSVIDLAQLADGRPYIVMEYIEGQTLAAIARGGPVPLGGLVQVMTEVLSALAAAHAIGIVHRDLKPDNVLVTAEGHAKVLDFGIAKLAPELHQQLSPRTRTGALLGTPQYMAPEQISGSGGVDPRTDVYAAGVVLYELATGQQPFVGETLFDLMRAHLEQPPRPPRALRPDLPPAFEQVILTALAKRPEARFPSAAAMADALQQAALALPAEQWRSLSSRALASVAGRGPPSGPGLPRAQLQTRPVGPAPTLEGRGKIGAIVGMVVVAAAAIAIWLFAATHGPASESVRVATVPGAAGGAKAVSAPNANAASGLNAAGQRAAGGANAAAPSTAGGANAAAPSTAAGAKAAVPSTPGGAGAPSEAEKRSAPGPTGGQGVPASSSAGARPDRAAPPSPGGAAPRRGAHTVAEAGSPPPSAAGAPASTVPGPVVVGGGSAADHGVVAGPNVSSGPNVIIGSATPAGAGREAIERPADYDPKHFDPVAYLPKALRLARELLPDAALTSFEFAPVFSDGHVDLTLEGDDRSFEFRSPERSAFPAGRPRNLPIERRCRVSVELGTRTVSARVLTSDSCNARLVHAPRCSFAAVWRNALAKGTGSDLVAKIGWLSDETWFFDIDLAGNGGGVSTFADRCP